MWIDRQLRKDLYRKSNSTRTVILVSLLPVSLDFLTIEKEFELGIDWRPLSSRDYLPVSIGSPSVTSLSPSWLKIFKSKNPKRRVVLNLFYPFFVRSPSLPTVWPLYISPLLVIFYPMLMYSKSLNRPAWNTLIYSR